MKIQKFIYLDNNATTPVDPTVLREMLPYFSEVYGNPSSSHHYGIKASAAIEAARLNIKSLFNIPDGDLYFTSSATASINLAIAGQAYGNYPAKKHLITQATEHPAVMGTFSHLQSIGFDITILDVDHTGKVDPDQLAKAIRKDTLLVSIMAANNEIGTLQDLAVIGGICKNHDVIFHSDVTQYAGRYELNMKQLNVDLLSGGAHKIHGPKGIGYLAINRSSKRIKINPLLFGGGQENGLSPGTLNTPLTVGLSKALSLMDSKKKREESELTELRNSFCSFLGTLDVNFLVNGSKDRLFNNLSLQFPGISAGDMLNDLSHIMFSTGAACSSDNGSRSHVLRAIGLNDEEIASTARFGFSFMNTLDEIQVAAVAISNYIKSKRKK
ncbi:MAG: cysteine desulfurase [Ignavibacteria bacterium]|nr:cysteine desulfurase [Ignavibacteria bacterium]